ncbi:endonuclease domain-containing protein [Kribbella sp. DT2]|uniref:endonuclease domain-containing protein n=1 Tax=Kribbella sp. DT2 TaxID=3393427 RepID=UPI003CF90D47
MLPYDAPLYFCGLPFTGRQVGRKLKWLQSSGDIRRVLKGAYVDACVPDSPELRAAAVALFLPPDTTASGRTAAWIHGINTTALGESEDPGLHWTSEPTDTVEIAGLKVSSPASTALALALNLSRPFALSAVDAFLRSGTTTLDALRELASHSDHPRAWQARLMLGYADPRAESPGESWLRLRLLDAGFPRPTLQVHAGKYRLDLAFPAALEDGRRLGLEYDSDRWHSRPRQQARDERRQNELAALGWHIISVRRPDLWGSYPALELAVGSYLSQQPRLPRRW